MAPTIGSSAPGQRRWVGSIWIALGLSILLGALAVAIHDLARETGALLPSVVVGYVGMRVTNRGRRHFVPTGLDVLEDDPRPPVLYLRPFDGDGAEFQISNSLHLRLLERGTWRQLSMFTRLLRTNEQFLVRAFRRIGPLVAVGDPSARLPRLGAVRVYARDGEEWKLVVGALAARSRYVVLQVDLSSGLLWEVAFLAAKVPLDQLILMLPPEPFRWTRPTTYRTRLRRRAEQYARFREATAGVFPVALPPGIGAAQFLYFDADGILRPTSHRRELIFPLGRRYRNPEDPKLEALTWLNSVLI